MFEIARRGFLKTTAAAAVGMLASFDTATKAWFGDPATFDTETNLWIPDSHLAVRDEVLEQNDIALRFAKEMAERMGNDRAQRVVLHQVLFEQGTRLSYGGIRLEKDGRTIYFEPERRIVKTGDATNPKALIDMAASQTMHDVHRYHITAFAPINAKMRNGGDFSNATVGLATDPVSGLSARSLKFKDVNGQVLTALELAVGTWEPGHVGARARRRFERTGSYGLEV